MSKDIEIAISARNSANQELQRLSRELGSVARALKDISGPAGQAAAGTKRVGDAADEAGRKADSASGKFASLGVEMARGAAMGVGFAAFEGIMRGASAGIDFLGDAAVGLNSKLQQAEIGFTTMLGSAQAADTFLRNLGEFAASTPFEFEGLVTASQRMLAFGFEAEQVIPLLTSIGDAVAAMGGGAAEIDRVTLSLGQMQAKTRVQAEEMLQLTEAGIPAWQLLAEHVDMSVAQIQEAVSRGEISADVFISAFQKFSTANYGDMMMEQSRTFQGAMSNIQDALSMATADAFQPFYEMLNDGAIELADFLGSPEFASFASEAASAMETAGGAVRDFVETAGPGFIDVGIAAADLISIVNDLNSNLQGMGGSDGQSGFQKWIQGVKIELELMGAGLNVLSGEMMFLTGTTAIAAIELEKMALVAEAIAKGNLSDIPGIFEEAAQRQRDAANYAVEGAHMASLGVEQAFDAMSGSARTHTTATATAWEAMSSDVQSEAQRFIGTIDSTATDARTALLDIGVAATETGRMVAEAFAGGASEGGGIHQRLISGLAAATDAYQSFMEGTEEAIIGPLLSMEPLVREELKDLFTLDPEIGTAFAGSISGMVQQGSISLEEGMDILSAIPRDTLEPALQEMESELHGKLAEALISGDDTNHIREQLAFIQSLMGETSEFVASSAIGFNEFATASEEAFGRVHDAALSLADVQSIVNDAVSTTAGNMSHWESSLNDIEKALEPLQQKMEDGIELSKEEAELYDTLTWGAERYAGGIENDLMPAFQDAVANSVEFTRRQDELNQMLEDGTISQEEHKDMMLDAALAGDDASLAAYGLAEAQGDVAEAINGVIDRIRDLLVELGLIPDEHTIKLNLDTSSARAAFDAFMSTVYSSNPTAEAGVGFTQRAGGGTIPPGGEFALVGEEGPELMMLPGGAHIYPHDETMRMIRGYAAGTPDRPQLTDGERQAIRILGEMDVVITPESMAQADAELAALLDARAMAVELGLGDAIIAQLDEDIAAKQGEIDLIGRIAGSAWGEGFLAELEAVDATEAMAGLLGDFSLEDIVSGKAGTDLGQQLVDLLELEKVALEMGDLDLAAMYREQADSVNAELERLGQVMGTAYVQGQIDGYNADQVAAEWDARLADALAGPGFGAGIQSSIDEMNEKIDLGILLGAPMDVIAGWQAERDQLVEEGQAYWSDVVTGIAAGAFSPEEIAAFAEAGGDAFMDAMGETFSPEAIENIMNPINEMGEEAFDALMGVFGSEQGKEVAGQFIDDIVNGLHDGTFTFEQAMELLGQAGADALVPGLEAIEKQLTVDLVNAIIAGNTELEADILEKLELLGILQGELDLTIDKAKEYQALDLWSGPAGAPGTMGAGGGGGGGGYGGGGPQKSTGSSPTTGRNPNYEYNLGPDAHGYHYQTLRQKYGLDMSFQMATSGDVQGAHDFYNNPNQMGYKVEKVQDHLKKNPDLMNDPEYWAHLEEGYGVKKGFVTHGVTVTNVNPDGTIEYSGGGDQITYAPTGTGPPPGVHPLKMARGGVSMGMPLFNTIWGEAGQEAYLPLEGRGADVVAEALGSRITNPLLALLENIGRDDRVEAHDRIDRMEQRQVEMSEWFKVMVAMLERVVDAPFVLDGKEIHRSIGKVVMHNVSMRGSR